MSAAEPSDRRARHGRGPPAAYAARRRDHHAAASPCCSRSSSAASSCCSPGHDPIATYKAIFDGTGLNWFFPWTSADDRTVAALNLQQTLIATTPLILTGLAVAFAFRCGLFNIGGQGQYLVGTLRWRCGSARRSPACRSLLHIVLCMIARRAWRARCGAGSRAC